MSLEGRGSLTQIAQLAQNTGQFGSIAYGLSHELLDLKIGKDGPSIDDYLFWLVLAFDARHSPLSHGIDLYPSVWTVDVGSC